MKEKEVVLRENPYRAYIDASVKIAKKEKELEEQKTLDFQKWLDSERKHIDLSGLMDQCLFCSFRDENRECTCDPKTRSEEAVCAKAYHEMKKSLL